MPEGGGATAPRALPEGVHLRPMTASDGDAVAAIEARSFSDPWPARAFTTLLERSHARLQLAVNADGQIIGYCVMLMALDEREIANICVDSVARGHGVAGLLLDEALASADDALALTVFLEVRESNTAARRLYASRGFRMVGRRRGYYQHPTEDALVLRRDRPSRGVEAP